MVVQFTNIYSCCNDYWTFPLTSWFTVTARLLMGTCNPSFINMKQWFKKCPLFIDLNTNPHQVKFLSANHAISKPWKGQFLIPFHGQFFILRHCQVLNPRQDQSFIRCECIISGILVTQLDSHILPPKFLEFSDISKEPQRDPNETKTDPREKQKTHKRHTRET